MYATSRGSGVILVYRQFRLIQINHSDVIITQTFWTKQTCLLSFIPLFQSSISMKPKQDFKHIVSFRLDPESNLLTLVQEVVTLMFMVMTRIIMIIITMTLVISKEKLGGTWPRSLAISGSIGAVIDQKGDSVQLLHIDEVIHS